VINVSWLITLGFVTSMLALRFYPAVLPDDSPYRNDHVLHWAMAIVSGVVFFTSIVLHELAHSLVARKQGIPVKNITLFVFGGVSQIGGEGRRPLNEFVMAIVGPLTSVALAGVFFLIWEASGHSSSQPAGIVLQWLFLINLALAAFNMAPGFPMDGGRVLRSLLWGITGNLLKATRLATLAGRSIGYSLIMAGALAFFGLISFIDPWSGAWFALLGLFLESSARQSWLQAKALDLLSGFKAEQLMNSDLWTAHSEDQLRYLLNRGGPRFIFFVSDEQDRVVGVLTEKEAGVKGHETVLTTTAGDVMVPTQSVPVAEPKDDGASMLQKMEEGSVWHLPVVSEGRVIGVVSKENLLRLLARALLQRTASPASP
jgi:Zn-dependent protease/CBS domain-containing protein